MRWIACEYGVIPGIDVPLVPLAAPVEGDFGVVFAGRVNEACHGLLEGVGGGLDPAALAGFVVGLHGGGDALVVWGEGVPGVVGEAGANGVRAGGGGRRELLDDRRGRAAGALLEDGLSEGVGLHGRERVELGRGWWGGARVEDHACRAVEAPREEADGRGVGDEASA